MAEERRRYFTREWTTFEGKKVTLETIDHQHLSNVYWFTKIFYKATDDMQWDMLEQFDKRFNGVVLDYRPKANFIVEIETLKRAGMVQKDDTIIFKGEVIGKIVYEIENGIES
jgi:hypothetical protein